MFEISIKNTDNSKNMQIEEIKKLLKEHTLILRIKTINNERNKKIVKV